MIVLLLADRRRLWNGYGYQEPMHRWVPVAVNSVFIIQKKNKTKK